MRRGPRGGPGDFAARMVRVERLLTEVDGPAADPLSVLATVLAHQQERYTKLLADPETNPETDVARPVAGRGHDSRSEPERFPLVDMEALIPPVVAEVAVAVEALQPSVPQPLAEAGGQLAALLVPELAAVVETWFDDVALVDPRLAFWIRVAAGPVLEQGATAVALPADWAGAACPVCGGPPQASVIAEESGEFMAGSPRWLVCGRCASWWSYPRATCVRCGEQDPRCIESFFAESRPCARVDTCTTCGGYVKTFDLREPGGVDVVPLVDDVATLTLDVWARDRGLSRPMLSLAGV